MAQYPQGVTDFIPDYQPTQPDFNFLSNVIQLKQSQYDQNWSKLNNMYGQLLNAPLTHDESVKKRDNTFKRMDFNLKRVTGMDLSLEQNVQQATQLFRPFYEDSNLMKDMAFTKNVGFERSLGEGKRISTDENINKEYWKGGIDAIDYRVQEFKATPYDQLTGFGDVKYTPYVNVEKMAQELALKMKIDVKSVTPQGDWMVTQKNGQQIIQPLQSLFFNAYGKDPKVRDFYSTLAYLERKNTVARDKDKPEFGGNAELAEKDYLNRTLKVMKNQTTLNKTTLVSERNTNDKMIKKLEKSLADGTDIETTQGALDSYMQANEDILSMLKQNEDDLKMLDGNLNSTLTSQGGSKLSTDNIEELRAKVDAATGSNLLQADLNKAVMDYVGLHSEVSYDPNPFAVQRQKYQYDSSLIGQRASAQKDVALFKYNLDMDKLQYKAKVDSGMYSVDPKNGKLEIKPELANVEAVVDLMAKTSGIDPKEIRQNITDLFKGEANSAKTAMASLMNELQAEGTLSNNELLYIMQDEEYSGFNMKPMLKWLKDNGGKSKDTKLDPKMGAMLMEEGMYTTSLEKEMMGKDAGFEEGQAKLQSMARGSLEDVSPEAVTRMTKRLLTVIDKKKDDVAIRENSNVKKLVTMSHSLDDYAGFRRTEIKAKEKWAQEVAGKMKSEGFQYPDAMFDDELNFVADEKAFLANVAKKHPNDIQLANGMSWGGFWNTVSLGATGGAAVGLMGGPFAPITSTAGFLGGAASGALAYTTTNLLGMGYNALFGGDSASSAQLKNANTSSFGNPYTVSEEFEAMKEAYDTYVSDSRLTSEIPGLEQIIGSDGTGKYTKAGSGITIEPGILSPTYQHFLEIKKVLRNLDTGADDGNTYVSFGGVNEKFDNIDLPLENAEAWATIWADLNPRTGKKDSGLGRFMVGISPLAGEDATKAAIQFRLPEEYLKKFKPDAASASNEDERVMSLESYNKMLKNGITIVTDARNLSGLSMYRNSFKTPEQLRIEKAGGEGVTYTDPTLPGIELNYKMNPVDQSKIIVTTSYDQYMGPGVERQRINLVTSLSNQGVNLKTNRENFFVGDASSGDIDGPKIQKMQNQSRKQYGN